MLNRYACFSVVCACGNVEKVRQEVYYDVNVLNQGNVVLVWKGEVNWTKFYFIAFQARDATVCIQN